MEYKTNINITTAEEYISQYLEHIQLHGYGSGKEIGWNVAFNKRLWTLFVQRFLFLDFLLRRSQGPPTCKKIISVNTTAKHSTKFNSTTYNLWIHAFSIFFLRKKGKKMWHYIIKSLAQEEHFVNRTQNTFQSPAVV